MRLLFLIWNTLEIEKLYSCRFDDIVQGFMLNMIHIVEYRLMIIFTSGAFKFAFATKIHYEKIILKIIRL